MKNLLLGSQSPRRAEILGYFALPFTQVASGFDEDSILFDGDPEAYVTALAKAKATALCNRFPNQIILTADTVVFRSGKIYGKPTNFDHAVQSLQELVGRWHTVYTGVVVQKGEAIHHAVEATHVLFNALTEEQIRHYLGRTEWADKAGGYAIQQVGGLIVRRTEGCYYNVMGLPINTVHDLLKIVGIDLWNQL